jgi:RNA polymerase sigma-70 factor (ECF subfamily)
MTAPIAAQISAFSQLERARDSARSPGGSSSSGWGGPANGSASDDDLMARLAQGDRQAMQVLYGRHHVAVYRFALRLTGNSATAEDIVSETFLALWRHATSFEGRARLSTWLLAIARNKAVSALRGRTEEALDEEFAQGIPDETPAPDETLDAGRRSALLARCLATLSGAHREIIDLVYYHERSVEEAASILGVPAATVKTRMFYARKRLADCLQAEGVATALA